MIKLKHETVSFHLLARTGSRVFVRQVPINEQASAQWSEGLLFPKMLSSGKLFLIILTLLYLSSSRARSEIMARVIAYIDGFNLYHGLREKTRPRSPDAKSWRKLYWLNVQQLVESVLKNDQELVFTKYFTARISKPDAKRERQSDYIDALKTLPQFEIIEGQYQTKEIECRKCSWVNEIPNEKMTDVNIAVEMLKDAFQDRFDVSILVSGDSDLTAPIAAIRQLFPQKTILLLFPPARFSNHLAQPHIASAFLRVRERDVKHSQFPDEVVTESGIVLRNPWPNTKRLSP